MEFLCARWQWKVSAVKAAIRLATGPRAAHLCPRQSIWARLESAGGLTARTGSANTGRQPPGPLQPAARRLRCRLHGADGCHAIRHDIMVLHDMMVLSVVAPLQRQPNAPPVSGMHAATPSSLEQVGSPATDPTSAARPLLCPLLRCATAGFTASGSSASPTRCEVLHLPGLGPVLLVLRQRSAFLFDLIHEVKADPFAVAITTRAAIVPSWRWHRVVRSIAIPACVARTAWRLIRC